MKRPKLKNRHKGTCPPRGSQIKRQREAGDGERGRKWDSVQSNWESQGGRPSTTSARRTHEKVKNYRAVLPLFTESTSAPGSVLSPREKKAAQV